MNVGLVAGVCLALSAVPSMAQNSGYAGPPKTQPGNQMTLEQFLGLQPIKKSPVKRRFARHRKPSLETGSIPDTASSETVTCKHFEATISQTITVPCR